MKKATRWNVIFGAAIALAMPVGCTDVGDDNSATSSDAGTPTDGATIDSSVSSSDDGGGSSQSADGGGNTGNDGAAMMTGTGGDDSGPSSSGGDDSESQGTPDTGVTEGQDAETPDANEGADTGASSGDGGEPDAGIDAGEPDTGTVVDAGEAIDAGVRDAGSPDATLPEDAGTPDSGSPKPDSGSGTLLPCTQRVGGHLADGNGGTTCVQCPDSPTSDGVCTATEAVIVAFDVARGNVDPSTHQLKALAQAGNSTTGSCYLCLNSKSCLDDDNADTGYECADTLDLTGQPAGSGVTQCLATLSCILQTDCQGPGGIAGSSDTASEENVGLCYCGADFAGSTCTMAGGAVDGLCVTTEVAGFGFAASDNKDIINNYDSLMYPSGSANELLACGINAGCVSCK
jgi:hypothetical protein